MSFEISDFSHLGGFSFFFSLFSFLFFSFLFFSCLFFFLGRGGWGQRSYGKDLILAGHFLYFFYIYYIFGCIICIASP